MINDLPLVKEHVNPTAKHITAVNTPSENSLTGWDL